MSEYVGSLGCPGHTLSDAFMKGVADQGHPGDSKVRITLKMFQEISDNIRGARELRKRKREGLSGMALGTREGPELTIEVG